MSDPYLLHHTLRGGHESSIISLAFSPTGDYLASGGEDSAINIWNVHDGTLAHRIQLKSPILCLEWDPWRQNRIFCGCQNGTAAYFDNFQVKFFLDSSVLL